MSKNATWCSKVSDGMNCPKCKEKKVIKNGRTKNNKQQYYCKMCFHRFIDNYTNQAYKLDINQNIIQLTKEGLAIRGTARILYGLKVFSKLKFILMSYKNYLYIWIKSIVILSYICTLSRDSIYKSFIHT